MKRSSISQIYAGVLVNAIYAMENYPIMLLNSMLMPFSMLVVITLASRGALIGVSILGAFISALVSNGILLQADISHLKNDLKLQEMIVSSPTPQINYVLGMALSELVYTSPTLLVLFVLALLFIHASIVGAAIAALAILLIFVIATAIGYMFSTFRLIYNTDMGLCRHSKCCLLNLATRILPNNLYTEALPIPRIFITNYVCKLR